MINGILRIISTITNNLMHMFRSRFVLRSCTHEIDEQFRFCRVYIVSYYITIFVIIIILYDRRMRVQRTCLRATQSDKTTNSILIFYMYNIYRVNLTFGTGRRIQPVKVVCRFSIFTSKKLFLIHMNYQSITAILSLYFHTFSGV